MRTMLLSFKVDVYKRVITGEKIYEYRKVFPDELVVVYLYVSAPVKAITGIMKLNNKTSIESWKDKYSYDDKALTRIDEYLVHHKYAMEITEFQETNRIPLEQLRDEMPGFVVPQMYYYIENSELLKYLGKKLQPIGEKIVHDFSDISSDLICKH